MSSDTPSREVLAVSNVGKALDVTDADLNAIQSADDVQMLFDSMGAQVDSVDDFGTGFEVLDTKAKDQLVGMPFIIVRWRFNQGDMGEFVSAEIVTKNGQKLILNDGSTGVYKQLQSIAAARAAKGNPTPQAGLKCLKGLSRSDYMYVNDKGDKSPASTYYLA